MSTDRVTLRMSQLTGAMSSINAPNFAVNELGALFTGNGINQSQIHAGEDLKVLNAEEFDLRTKLGGNGFSPASALHRSLNCTR